MSAGTKLPTVIDQVIREDIVSAYNICLRCEEELERELTAGRDATKDLIDCRIVGYLFHHSPTNKALETVVDEVLCCVNREDLLKLGRMYFDYLLKPFYHVADGTVHGDEKHPPSFVPLNAVARKVMNTTARNNVTAHDRILVRDGYSCVLTGTHDRRAMQRSKDLREKFPSGPQEWTQTFCAYIFKEDSRPEFDQGDTSEMCSILKRFGYKNLSAELTGNGFYRSENILNLSCMLLSSFNEMNLWFSETTQPHTYQVKAGSSFKEFIASFEIPDYVTFTTPSKARLPLPSPTYLKLHAAVCKIGELSGATESIKQFYLDLDDLLLEESVDEDELLSSALGYL